MRRHVAPGARLSDEVGGVNGVLGLKMAPEPPRPLRGLTILVIDDHRDTVDMFQQYFTASGAEAIGARARNRRSLSSNITFSMLRSLTFACLTKTAGGS
jgi:hypothetical protein